MKFKVRVVNISVLPADRNTNNSEPEVYITWRISPDRVDGYGK